MKFSIVTISYNQKPYLKKAIDSVLSQDGVELEYIIVDGLSTDGSEVVLDYAKSRGARVICEPDYGPADALRKGLAVATGDIMGFVNSDDVLLPGALKTVVREMSRRPDVDVLSGHGYVIDNNGDVRRKIFSDRMRRFTYAYGVCHLVQQATFFRRNMYVSTKGINPENKIAWDGELWADLLMAGARFGLCNKYLGCFRVWPGTITSRVHAGGGLAKYEEMQFEKMMGRKCRSGDEVIRLALRVFRLICQPRALRERLKNGRVV